MEARGEKSKETKNAVVFETDQLGSVYVPKPVWASMGSPATIKIEIKPA